MQTRLHASFFHQPHTTTPTSPLYTAFRRVHSAPLSGVLPSAIQHLCTILTRPYGLPRTWDAAVRVTAAALRAGGCSSLGKAVDSTMLWDPAALAILGGHLLTHYWRLLRRGIHPLVQFHFPASTRTTQNRRRAAHRHFLRRAGPYRHHAVAMTAALSPPPGCCRFGQTAPDYSATPRTATTHRHGHQRMVNGRDVTAGDTIHRTVALRSPGAG